MRRPKKSAPPERPTRPDAEAATDVPSLVELERFTHASLRTWLVAHGRLNSLQTALYFGLESARQAQAGELVNAIRSAATSRFEFEDWARIVDYRYGIAPLSCAGSLKTEGGRFNVGRGLNPTVFTPFPALYIGDSFETALHERFGQSPTHSGALSATELALRKLASFSHVRIRGRVEQVLDTGNLEALKPIAEVLKLFALPMKVAAFLRKLGMRHPPRLI